MKGKNTGWAPESIACLVTVFVSLPRCYHLLLSLKTCGFHGWSVHFLQRKDSVVFCFWPLILYFLGSRYEFPVSLFPVWVLYQYSHMASGISFQVKKKKPWSLWSVYEQVDLNDTEQLTQWYVQMHAAHLCFHASWKSCPCSWMCTTIHNEKVFKTSDWIRTQVWLLCSMSLIHLLVLLYSWLTWNLLGRPNGS